MSPHSSANGDLGRSLRDILIGREYITVEQWDEAERLDTEDPLQALIARGWLHPTHLARARAARVGLEFRELTAAPDPRLGDALPADLRRSGRCAVLEVTPQSVVVAVADPTLQLRDEIATAIRPRRAEIVVVTQDRLPPPADALDDEIATLTVTNLQQDLSELTAAPHIVRLLSDIIDGGIAMGASDIHIADFGEGIGEARYRVDGKGTPGVRFQRRHLAGLISRIKLLARRDIAHHQTPQSGDMRWPSPENPKYDLRIEVGPDDRGEDAVVRIFGHIAHQELDDLGFTSAIHDQLDQLCTLPHGLVLVTGPTGCGKSTTLAVLLRRIHQRFPDKFIYTVENPVEQKIPGIIQTSVDDRVLEAHRSRTFALMLRSFLRRNPDVIMVGEIRDKETATVAVDAALTGHLVLSTLHTNTAPGAVPRLMHMGVEAHLLADTLQAVLGQRLLRRICAPSNAGAGAGCARPVAYEGAELELANRLGLANTEMRGDGCERCYGGYRGRLAIGELMVMTPKARGRLTDQTTEQDLRLWTQTPTLLSDGVLHVRAGETTLSEVMRATWTPEETSEDVPEEVDTAIPEVDDQLPEVIPPVS
ncbi:MAG TPA: ATPase, T2SS/T4P/T4SS family [bacterium]|nr:ATPase, T2SS/T4P/T4SS family [bacterium]